MRLGSMGKEGGGETMMHEATRILEARAAAPRERLESAESGIPGGWSGRIPPRRWLTGPAEHQMVGWWCQTGYSVVFGSSRGIDGGQ